MRKWIVIGIILVLLVAGVAAYKYFMPASKVDQFSSDDEGFSYSGEIGDLQVGYTDPALSDFEVPVYPGAKAVSKNSTGNVIINGQKFLMGSFTSDDSKSNIISYYQEQIEGAITGTLEKENPETVIRSPNGPSVSISTKNSTSYIVIVKPL